MLKLLLFGLVFIQIAYAAHEQDAPLDGRIIGGNDTYIIDYPYQVSIEYLNSHRCGGSIIARTWILTAAHCIESYWDLTAISVRVGASYLLYGGTLLNVSEVISHDNYSIRVLYDFDISLLRLETPIPLSSYAQIVALPNDASGIDEGYFANVTGWGVTSTGSNLASEVLQVVEVPIISEGVCKDLYRTVGYTITDQMFCAGNFEGGKDSCSGDGGGPLVSNGVLRGIVSWGLGCAQARQPGVYTHVGILRDWITEVTGI